MKPARGLSLLALLAILAACSRDPMDDPEYAAMCHGPPLANVEARNEAFVNGYRVEPRYDCIAKDSWEAMQVINAQAAAARAARQREEAKAPAPMPASLVEARQGFTTTVREPANGAPLPKPPAELFVRSDYKAGEGRELAAFVSPDPRDGKRHPAIVWLTGGDSSTLGDFWSPGAAQDDQSASAFRQAGLIMMFPTLRGGNTDSGRREYFYGEVDDVHAAANHLARLPYVDPARIFLGGHSTGGTLALLAAETGGRFAAVFAFGAVDEIERYPASLYSFDLAALDERERQLRSPRLWLNAISTPTYLIEGTEEPANVAELDALCAATRNEMVFCIRANGFNHFSAIDAVGRVLAPRLAANARMDGGPWLTPVEISAANR